MVAVKQEIGESIAWQNEKGDLLLGKIIKVGERFYTVKLTGIDYKRSNAKKIPLGTNFLVNKMVAIKQNNPYISDAQRRKLHAMAERGEISKKVVKEFDKTSKELKLPKKVNCATKTRVAKKNVAGSVVAGKRNPKLSLNEFRYKYLDGTLTVDDILQVEPKLTRAQAEKQLKTLRAMRPKKTDWIGQKEDEPKGRYRGVSKKKNATASEFKQHQSKKLTTLAKMFQGVANGDKKRVLESDYTPKDKYRLGYLVQLKIKDGGKVIPINFDGEAYLAADLRNNLIIVGKDARIVNTRLPAKGQLRYLGELIQIDYVTAKKHIEAGKTVRFYHKLGEVTKEMPNLFIDDEGFPVIIGGGYDVWSVGIVN